ncbi:MAG: ribosome maturation factor RimM [Parvibaculum sp.]|uniref:ribosome maturation factor RimM n=1 Tax=Parvibaculum sp. TaxID=2024848 RepID=UPI0027219590|nr:ribosome maturation factor RimM [Parvibaculum sp.]MDO8837727.1 ribosome maturation factor RimM [Parvibaculum sp.]
MADGPQKKVCLGVVVGAHGVRGLVRVKPFTEAPDGVAAYGPVETVDGARRFAIEAKGMVKELVLCRLDGIDDRDAAEALRGTELYVSRDRLPPADADEGWYHADLVGLRAVGLDGHDYGAVVAVLNFGAGDLLEIAPPDGGATVLMGFTEANVPEVDIAGGRIVIDPPLGTFDDVSDAEGAADGD